jgi:subtilisin family serine protease
MKTLLDGGYEFIVVQSAGNGQNGYAQDAIYTDIFAASPSRTFGSYSSEMRTKINERILIVGAAQRWRSAIQQAQFSNGGAQVDICAPGYDVYSCYGNSSYWYMSGTSMSRR